ncbi:hypothetical protein F8154_01165 [Alkaliphilus pronyensis]|uniref:Uncharacterized protein n=1 Tax=Alkaliphilus pronyensis TaxID=1482732 RepID=A0A6I0F7Z9_9FIRM|nr:hypothetical protein [Alkaliphilus pronyensis]KAB3539071.1 hypothetical protein F8154_01165 [Alkaliphilus pronyensis]
MTKVIGLKNYQSKKSQRKCVDLSDANTIDFKEIKEGIKNLALKDKEVIFSNVKYYYKQQYKKYLSNRNTIDFTFKSFLANNLNLKEPFKINHGIDFAREYAYNSISVDDWKNISDIIVRMSLSYTLDIIEEQEKLEKQLDPLFLAKQYKWEKVKIDIKQKSKP